jgi:transcriptional regulator with XRE-family HTH domain
MKRDEVPGFGAHLKALREAAGLTQPGLAEAAGTHFTTVAKIEADDRTPGLRLLLALADALGTDLNGLDPRPAKRRKGKG